MNKELTEIVFILDASGSMAGLESDTIGGFNSLLKKQQQAEGQALLSTVVFANDSTVLYDRQDIQSVAPMTDEQYQVGGCTALLDAIGGAVHHIANVHRYAREEDRPARTIFVITTDGCENASRHYSYDQVQRMVRRQQERFGWEFLFLGANMDAIAAARSFGIRADRSVRYCPDEAGTDLNYTVVNDAIASFRACGDVGEAWSEPIAADYRRRGK